MESWFCWIHLVILFRNIWAALASSPHYTIHQDRVSFDEAAKNCSPGVLTTLATELEVADILGLISQSTPAHQKEFTFWAGLKKDNDKCVVSSLPLRGFKWTDGSEDTQVSRWTEEPKATCTVRCAALKGERDGSEVTRWGLISVTCKKTYPFICKLRDSETGVEPEAPEPPKSTAPEPPKPTATESQKQEPRPATQKPELANPEPELPSLGPKLETDLKPEKGPELQEPDPNPGLDSCQPPVIHSARSISFDNRSRVQVECWSTDQVELRCSGRPAVWRLLDDSPANSTTVCLPCENGFRKDLSGNCVDVDECGGSSAPCRHTCLNTAGSYRCFCSDENGKHHNEDSPACADTATGGILIPVLVAVAALAVLVVVVAVTVKCCLMRQSKKQAMKTTEKMAMKSNDGRDSFETANEKAS